MAKKKSVEPPTISIEQQVKELQKLRETSSAQEQIFIDQQILELTKEH